jgi:endo-1,4-beta-xylanase
MQRVNGGVAAILSFLVVSVADATAVSAQDAVLPAQFTRTPIVIDGVAEAAWRGAPAVSIAICMTNDLSSRLSNCETGGTARAMWDGPLLYLLITVADADVTTASRTDTNRDSVEIYVDQYNDKFPKFEEDDGVIRISAAGQLTGNTTNAGLTTYGTVWSSHLKSHAAAVIRDPSGTATGYTIEAAWHIGDRPKANGTAFGMEFAINDATGATDTRQRRVFWSSGANKGTDSNTMWGTVVLSGYDGPSRRANDGASSLVQPDTFMLSQNLAKANGLVRGIWTSEAALDRAVAKAAATVASTTSAQAEIDAANAALDAALRGLRRAGKYPDPYDLPAIASLNDPFVFFNGSRVKSFSDWRRRREEIKDLAQYYEFGFMPGAPESLVASATPATFTAPSKAGGGEPFAYTSVKVDVRDGGRSASFTAALSLPASGAGPFPVVVSLDFRSSPSSPTSTYPSAGYAVLSIPASDLSARLGPSFAGIATDDDQHGGAYFTLYPYDVAKGRDAGVLLAWAWGASRGVDALKYLAAHDEILARRLDLDKLVVTGFSRMGKAALVAGLLDDRFKITVPGASGSGGAAPYRYDSFGNTPYRGAPFGNVYPWGRSPGAETMGDHVRHQTHNSNEMIRRFLNDTVPAAAVPRMYKADTHGYGTRMPFDHHLLIAAVAPRAVLIDNTNDDYADNAEGDAIGYEGAKPVYQLLGVAENLALDIFMGGGGHSLKASQAQHIVDFSDRVFFGTPMEADVRTQLTTDPYLDARTYDTYYGGLASMMPWLATMARVHVSPPLHDNTPNVVEAGAVVPVRFSLMDAARNRFPDATPRVYLAPIAEGRAAGEVAAASRGGDNLCRYDRRTGLYAFDLETKGLAAGTYRIRIDIGDYTTTMTVK